VHCVADCICDRVRFALPQPTEWQLVGDELDAAFIFTLPNFVNVHSLFATFRLKWADDPRSHYSVNSAGITLVRMTYSVTEPTLGA
jgi:hypothetical protein